MSNIRAPEGYFIVDQKGVVMVHTSHDERAIGHIYPDNRGYLWIGNGVRMLILKGTSIEDLIIQMCARHKLGVGNADGHGLYDQATGDGDSNRP